MATNKNQHFVPRCYLRPFTLNEENKAINLFNIYREKPIHLTPVKHQCSRDYFYGDNPKLENAIQFIEGSYATAINELLSWSETLAKEGRETQKKFLGFCLNIFRQALLKNYKVESLIYFESKDFKFSLEKFAPFVHQNNIFGIMKALEDAEYHVERNGNAKIIFTDLSIQLTRLIHKKELA